MKHLNIYLFLLFISFFQFVDGQQNSAILHGNSVAVTIFDRGRLFHDKNIITAGYEMPAGSGNHLIFNGGFWFGGTNQNGDLKIAGDLFGQNLELYRGPYSSTNSYYDTAYMNNYQSGIWTVTKSEIIYHIDNYANPAYTAPDGIANWPGNGNPAIGVAQQLAPYVDVNNNGIYEPYSGDYPCIKGDAASFQIINEDQAHNFSGGEKVGIEIHLMLYQTAADNYIDSTTFVDVTVINKGQNIFDDFRVAFFIDPDIGLSEDDYIGTASSKNMMYAYNAYNYDDGQGGQPGYGSNPPALGLVTLNKTMDYAGTFYRSDVSPNPILTDPETAEEFWNLMNGKWRDGSPWTYGGQGYGGTVPTHYLYDGNPYLNTGWTEINVDGNGTSNPSSDRRLFVSSVAESLHPGDSLVYNYALITNAQGPTPLENVQGLYGYADSVQHYFDNTTYSCIQQGTGFADVLNKEENNLLNFKITRADGEGNMSLPVAITSETEQHILDSNAVQNVTYQRGQGPIQARLTDSVGYPLGHFVLKFNKYDKIDTANWTIYHYDTLGGNLIDSVNSTSSIDTGFEQFIPQWKMAIKIKQKPYICYYDYYSCSDYDKIAAPIASRLVFSDDNHKWLTGVKNINGMAPSNWIMSGGFTGPDIPSNGIHNPACYPSNHYDLDNLFTDLAGGIISPGRLARYGDCELTPIGIPNSSSLNINFGGISKLYLSTINQPSIDIVFTSDKSKWTRSPVIELNKNESQSINGGKSGFLRNSPSVDKEGNPDGTGNGMGWFPGYAIDVETGRRLNIAFCENSTMADDNGDDMIWNPSERLMDANGNYVLGGQHTIYVFGGESKNMPNYDEGAFIYQNLQAESSIGFNNVYANLSWVVQPLLQPGEQLNATDARLEVRINKEFKTRVLSNKNEGRPMFFWDVIPYEDVLLTSAAAEKSKGEIKIYPNPASNSIVVVWKAVKVDDIKILSYQGKLIKELSVKGLKGEKTIDINGLAPGIYFVSIGNTMRKLIVQ